MMNKAYSEIDDNYPTCEETYATLRIYLPAQDNPDLISDELGIKPSKIQKKGEIHKGRKRKWPTAWFLSTRDQVESKDVRRHIEWLLDQLTSKEGILKNYQSAGYEMDIFCYWVSAQGHGGPMLSPNQMNRLAKCGLGISFDIYNGDNVHPALR